MHYFVLTLASDLGSSGPHSAGPSMLMRMRPLVRAGFRTAAITG